MSHIPNGLEEEFPEHVARLRELKVSDAHFAELAKRYDALNHEIHLADANVHPTDDFHLEEMKKRRLALLDEIAALLRRRA